MALDPGDRGRDLVRLRASGALRTGLGLADRSRVLIRLDGGDRRCRDPLAQRLRERSRPGANIDNRRRVAEACCNVAGDPWPPMLLAHRGSDDRVVGLGRYEATARRDYGVLVG